MPNKLTGVLLDIDGTLIDSNDANARAWMEALLVHGIEVNYLNLGEGISTGGDNFLPKIAHIGSNSAQGKAVSETRGEILMSKYLPTLHAFPQVKKLLTRLHDDGLKLVVATSAKPDEADALLHLTGAADLIDAIATTEDAESSKPTPWSCSATRLMTSKRPKRLASAP